MSQLTDRIKAIEMAVREVKAMAGVEDYPSRSLVEDDILRESIRGVARETVAYDVPMPREAFPVGSVIILVVGTDPADLLGYGTWSAIAAGKVLVGLDSGDTDFDALRETGGAKTVVSTGTVSQPTFTGDAVAAASTDATPDLVAPDVTGTGVSPVTTATGTVSQPTYTGDATSVVQPYYTVKFWERTA